jgi:hypothetical protein
MFGEFKVYWENRYKDNYHNVNTNININISISHSQQNYI